MYRKLEIQFAGRTLSLETGRLAKQSHGAVLAQYGETVVLASASLHDGGKKSGRSAREGRVCPVRAPGFRESPGGCQP